MFDQRGGGWSPAPITATVLHDFPSCRVGDLETAATPCEMLKMAVLQLGPP